MASATLIVLAVLLPAIPAQACDWAGWPSLEVVLEAARADAPLDWFPGTETVVGVQDVQVLAHAPALVPITSSRAGSTVVRSWGRQPGDARGALNPARSPYIPFMFVGRYGHGCSPPTHPPVGDHVLAVTVREAEGQLDFHQIDLPANTSTDEVAGRFDEIWGPPATSEVSPGDRVGAWVYAWWPLTVTVSAAVALGWITLGWIIRRKRQ